MILDMSYAGSLMRSIEDHVSQWLSSRHPRLDRNLIRALVKSSDLDHETLMSERHNSVSH